MGKQTIRTDKPPTVEQIFSRMAASILEHNDMCRDDEHRDLMRRTILDQLELGKRRVLECL
jgi:hypothetical protein